MAEIQPYILLLAGPSGAGKSSVIYPIVDAYAPQMRFSVSCTTRARREGEDDGEDYHFVTREQFEAERDAGGFAEWAEVFGNLYGTRVADLDGMLQDGVIAAVEIDVQGVRQLVGSYPDRTVSVFLFPPSWEEMELRLRARGSEDEETLARRLRDARAEVQAADSFDYWIVNEELAAAQMRLRGIIEAEYARRTRWPKHPLG
jgi:guanylate kinase